MTDCLSTGSQICVGPVASKNFVLEDKCGASCRITASKLKAKLNLRIFPVIQRIYQIYQMCVGRLRLKNTDILSLIVPRSCTEGVSSLGGETRSRHQMLGLVGRSTLHKPKQQRKAGTAGG